MFAWRQGPAGSVLLSALLQGGLSTDDVLTVLMLLCKCLQLWTRGSGPCPDRTVAWGPVTGFSLRRACHFWARPRACPAATVTGDAPGPGVGPGRRVASWLRG